MMKVTVHTGRKVTVTSLKEASQVVMAYRDSRGGIGAEKFYHKPGVGQVIDDGGKIVAVISYNGRAWEPDAAGRASSKEVVFG